MGESIKYYSQMTSDEKWEYLRNTAELLTVDMKEYGYKFSISSKPDTLNAFIPSKPGEQDDYAKAVMGMFVISWFGSHPGYLPRFNITVK